MFLPIIDVTVVSGFIFTLGFTRTSTILFHEETETGKCRDGPEDDGEWIASSHQPRHQISLGICRAMVMRHTNGDLTATGIRLRRLRRSCVRLCNCLDLHSYPPEVS